MPGLLKEDLTAFGSPDLLPSPLLDSLLSRHYHQLQHLRQQQENSSADALLKDAASYCSSPRSFLHAGGGNGALNGMNPSSRFMDFGKEEMLLASPGRSSNSSNSMGLNLDLKELQQAAAAAASSGFNSFSDASGSPCDSPLSTIGALQRFLPSNNEDSWTAEHVYSCDEFRMFEFKVRRCMRGRSHDWTECPFAHPGEKARRRDPRRFHYSGTACPDFRKGHCKNGDACELAHGVFECWLHPARYRTQPCKDGRNCKRRVCFFAHTPEQLRLPPPPPPPPSSKAEQNALIEQLMIQQQQQQGFERSYDGFLGENHRFLQQQSSVAASPTSTLVGLAQSPPPLSPPLSPGSSSGSPPMSPCSPSPQQQQNMAAAIARNVALLRASSPHLAAQAIAAHQAQAEAQAFLASPPPQRQLERINSMPGAAMSAAMSAEQRSRLLGSFSNSFNGRPNVNSLVAALRHMELKGEGAAAYSAPTAAGCGGYSACSSSSPPASPSWLPAAGRSPLYRSSDYVRSTASPLARQQQQMWGHGGNNDAARVESGRDLRAKVYGKISMENLPDSGDCPDLGWVSELVTEN